MSERDHHDHYYGHDAERIFESPIFRRVHDRVARQFVRRTGLGQAFRVLSLGCGDGAIERRLGRSAGTVLGIDVSPVAIEQARAKSASSGQSNLRFMVWDLAGAPPEDLGEFDVVAAFAFLHHLEEEGIAATFAAARKLLRPGGVFYSCDPSRRRLVGLFTALVRTTYDRYHTPGERELDPERLATLARSAGFSSVEIGYCDYALGPLAWLAPGTPRWLLPILEGLDNIALAVPFVRNFASSFRLVARA